MTEPVMVGGAPAAPGNKRAFVLLGVAAAIVVLVLVLPKLLFGGGSEAADGVDDFPVVPAGDLTGEPVEDESELAPAGETFSAKDPFEPLIDVAALAPATDDGGTTPVPVDVDPLPVAPLDEAPSYVPPVFTPAPAAAPSAPATVAAPPVGSSSPSPAPNQPAPTPAPTPAPATVPAAPAPVATERLALFEILVNDAGRTVAQIRLNGVRLEVAEGDAFGSGFRVVTLSLDDGCGEFLHGTTSFRQCEGVEKLT